MGINLTPDISIVHHVVKQFTLEFIRNPYLCYTEHGLHALFYTRLYNALPPDQRYTTWANQKVCVIQKEYPTAGNLGKPQRQHWDIAVVKTPPSSILNADDASYDYLRLDTVVEFGMNESKEHLIDDIERVSHEDANVDQGIIVHLYRLSESGSRFSNRDWSAKSKQIMSINDVARLDSGKSIEIYYGMFVNIGKYYSDA